MRALPVAELAPLIESATWARLLQLCKLFPVGVQTVCFECRLADDDPRVDLAFCVMPGPEVSLLAEALKAAPRSDPAWARFADFLEGWSGFEAPWSTQVPFICPAFDLDGASDDLPAPCLSVCVDADFYARRLGLAPQNTVNEHNLLALASDCHARLTGSELPATTLARLRTCLETGLEVEPKHMSWMMSRATSPMKLDIRLYARDITKFLTSIGFTLRARVEQSIARVLALLDPQAFVQLNLVLHPELGTAVELELFSVASDASAAERSSLLTHLVATGIASASKVDVLRAAWLQPKCQDEAGRVVAKSWYIKLRFEERGECNAKVYFGLIPRLLRPSAFL